MHACSDQAITLAAIAPYADSPVTITGIGHIRYQDESDRLTAISQELTRLGIRVRTWGGWADYLAGSSRAGESLHL